MKGDFYKKLRDHAKSHKINDYITLKLEQNKTFIYVADKRFLQCIRLILQIPRNDVHEFDGLDSIDEIEKVYNQYVWRNRIIKGQTEIKFMNDSYDITPEEEFWGHCSNLQAWAEHGYDTRILHRNIAFPLLKELAKVGDKMAKIRLKEEIVERFLSGSPTVINYLIEMGYLSYLNSEEFKLILENIEDIKSYLTLIKYFKKSRKDRDLLNILRRSLEIDPFNLYAWSELAQYYLERKIYDEALNAVTNALKIDESYKPALKILENIYRERKIDLSHRFKNNYVYILMNFDREQDKIIEKTKTYRRYKSRLTHQNKKK